MGFICQWCEAWVLHVIHNFIEAGNKPFFKSYSHGIIQLSLEIKPSTQNFPSPYVPPDPPLLRLFWVFSQFQQNKAVSAVRKQKHSEKRREERLQDRRCKKKLVTLFSPSAMVMLQFPSSLTDEELSLQAKYAKLRKKKKQVRSGDHGTFLKVKLWHINFRKFWGGLEPNLLFYSLVDLDSIQSSSTWRSLPLLLLFTWLMKSLARKSSSRTCPRPWLIFPCLSISVLQVSLSKSSGSSSSVSADDPKVKGASLSAAAVAGKKKEFQTLDSSSYFGLGSVAYLLPRLDFRKKECN